MSRRGVVVATFVAVLSTGGLSVASAQSEVTRHDLLSGKLFGATDDPTTSIASSAVLALSDEMREFLRDHVNRGATDALKLQQLVDAIMGTKTFRLEIRREHPDRG